MFEILQRLAVNLKFAKLKEFRSRTHFFLFNERAPFQRRVDEFRLTNGDFQNVTETVCPGKKRKETARSLNSISASLKYEGRKGTAFLSYLIFNI